MTAAMETTAGAVSRETVGWYNGKVHCNAPLAASAYREGVADGVCRSASHQRGV